MNYNSFLKLKIIIHFYISKLVLIDNNDEYILGNFIFLI